MSFPPLLLGAIVLFWGQQSGLWPVALVAAAALEGSRLVSRRWDLTPLHFGRISDLSAVGFLAMAAYAYLGEDAGNSFTKLTAWLPVVYVPLVVAQRYSAQSRIALSALFIFLREGKHEWSSASIDLAPAFAVLCLLSAAAANVRGPGFYAGLMLLSAWALWSRKPASTPRLAWSAIFAAAAVVGWVGQLGLGRLQERLERAATAFMIAAAQSDSDALSSLTAMAHIGKLKQSDRVVLRVRAPEGKPPALLRLAAYNRYAGLEWFAKNADLKSLAPDADGRTWTLATGPLSPSGRGQGEGAVSSTLELSYELPTGSGVLPLPPGAVRVEGLAAAALSGNRLGAVKADGARAQASYRAAFRPLAPAAADADDALVPPVHAPVFERVARDLGLTREDPRGSALKVARHFADAFTYSVYRQAGTGRHDPLAEFLLESKTGHCEHFASATVLLLRAAGIPARYATGYLIEEYSGLEGAYVARGRHAHAWALVHLDGRWEDLDTTPPAWVGLESERAPWHRPLSDVWGWAGFRLRAAWGRLGSQKGRLVALLVAALLFLTWRIARDFGSPGVGAEAAARRPQPRAGSDSELYRVERRLAELGLGRRDWEPVSAWTERLAASPGARFPVDSLRSLAALHERYRFDPRGLAAHERRRLSEAAAECERALGRLPR